MTGGDAVVEALARAGVTTVFGVVSVHNVPIFDAIARHGGIRLVPTRSEAGAVNMADGYARASGRMGVALTSTGTGAGNAMGPLVESQAAGTPVLHITGQVPSAHLGKGKGFMHEARDQFEMLRSVSKQAFRPASAALIPVTLAAAIQACRSVPSGPVSVELPIDYQEADIASVPVEPSMPLPNAPHEVAVARAVSTLAQARRPLIWAGGGVIASEAGDEVRRLAERLGAGVLTSQAGRGALPEDHPLCIGNFGPAEAVAPLLAAADVLLAVGTHFRAVETRGWHVELPPILQVDADPLAIGRSYPAATAVLGDARLVLRALLEHLPAEVGPMGDWQREVARVRARTRGDLRATLGPHERLCDDLRASLPRDAILVRDMTVPANTWGNRLLEVYAPRTSINATGGGIGQGLQMALGAKVAHPDRRVVVLCGDGGFLLNCGEMATAAQEGLAVVVLLFNDGGYGILRNIQRKQYDGRFIGVDLRTPDFQALAVAFGWQGHRVRSADAFRPTLEAALECTGPALVEIDSAAVGEMQLVHAGVRLS